MRQLLQRQNDEYQAAYRLIQAVEPEHLVRVGTMAKVALKWFQLDETAFKKFVKKPPKVAPSTREKILWGTLRQPGSNALIGGHFRGLISHPDYSTEIVGSSAVNPACLRVKFIKLLPGGAVSNIKSPASTLFPRGWSEAQIIKAIEELAANPASVVMQTSNNSAKMRGQIRGISIEVLVEGPGGKITAGYPL